MNNKNFAISLKWHRDWNEVFETVKIAVMDDALLNRPGPRLAEGHSQLIKLLHKQKDMYDDAMNILDSYYAGTPPMKSWESMHDGCCGAGHNPHASIKGPRILPKVNKK